MIRKLEVGELTGVVSSMFAVVLFADQFLKPLLDLPPKMLEMEHFDVTVHEAETVGWADDGIAVHVADQAQIVFPADVSKGLPERRWRPFLWSRPHGQQWRG